MFNDKSVITSDPLQSDFLQYTYQRIQQDRNGIEIEYVDVVNALSLNEANYPREISKKITIFS